MGQQFGRNSGPYGDTGAGNQLITAALMRHVLPRLGQPVVRTHFSCLSRESRAMQRSCATVIVCSVCVCVF